MDITILSLSLFFVLILIGYSFYTRKAAFLSIPGSILFIILATSIVAQGITIDYVTGYGFVASNNTSMVGAVVKTITFNDIFITGLGTFMAIIGLVLFTLSVYYFRKGTTDEEED